MDCQSTMHAMETFCRIFENFLLNKKGLLPASKTAQAENEEMEDAEGEASRKALEDSTTEYRLDDILKFVD